MNPQFSTRLRCPARDCDGANLRVTARCTEVLSYRLGPVEEVREGSLDCPRCGRAYPVEGYVPSFEQLFPPDLREEADYWSSWYRFMWDRGYTGFFDLRAPRVPLITEGITVFDPSSLGREESGGPHAELADHPLVKAARRVLDVGCGAGWSSLYLARRGHEVTAFDPSASNMRLAKRYAIAQGEYIEYVGAALGYISFEPEAFDAVFALHSLHHVPRLGEEMALLRSWLRAGGVIAVDEYIRTDPALAGLADAMGAWARAEVYPKLRTLDPHELRELPQAGHSALEGAGSGEVISALLDNFTLLSFSSRYVSLDLFSFIYYLSRDLNTLLYHDLDGLLLPRASDGGVAPNFDVRGYHYAGDVIHNFYKLWAQAHPDDGEYVTLVGRKGGSHPEGKPAEKAARLREGQASVIGLSSGAVGGAVGGAVEEEDKAATEMQELLADARGEFERVLTEMIRDRQAKDNYIEHLESTLSIKNLHIARLERLGHLEPSSKGCGQALARGALRRLRGFFPTRRAR